MRRRNMYLSSFMGLKIYAPSFSSRSNHFTAFAYNFNRITSHDHTEGLGKRITPAGLTFTNDFDFNGFAMTSLSSSEFISRTDAANPLSIYVKNDDFYVMDGNSNEIQLTSDGSFIGVGFDAIAGDYADSEAVVGFNSNTGNYYLKSESNKYANVAVGKVILTNTSGYSNTIAFNSASTYDITLPKEGVERPSLFINNSGITRFEASSDTQVNIIQVLSNGDMECKPIQLKNLPSGNPFKGLQYDASGDVAETSSSAVIIPYNTDTPENLGETKINSEVGTLDIFIDTLKKSISINTAGLSINDPVDVTVDSPQDNMMLTKVDGVWGAYHSLPVLWETVLNKPTDVTDLSSHTVDEFSDVSIDTLSEGDVLKLDSEGNFYNTPDAGEGAVWDLVTGDVSAQTDLQELLDKYMDKTGYLGEDSLLSDLSDVGEGATNQQILVSDAEGNLVPSDSEGGAASPITQKGGIWVATDNFPTNGELVPGGINTVLLYKNGELTWNVTGGLTGGGGNFIGAYIDSTRVVNLISFTGMKIAIVNVNCKNLLQGVLSLTVGSEIVTIEAHESFMEAYVVNDGDSISIDAVITKGDAYVTLQSN